MNIYFQTCGLVILILIMVLHSKRSVLNTPSTVAFRNLLIGVLISTCIDILSIIALNFEDYETNTTTAVVCRMYLISLAVVSHLVLKYTVCQLENVSEAVSRKIKILINSDGMIILLYAILSFFLEVDYFVMYEYVYTYGTYVMLTYAVALMTMILCLGFLIIYWKHINISRIKSTIFTFSILCVAGLIQFFNNELLLINFSLSLAMMYMYIYLENTNDYVDKICGIFNLEGAAIFLENKAKKIENINFITIEITGIKFINETFGTIAGNKLLVTIAKFLDTMNNCFIFRMNGAVFAVAHFGTEEEFESLTNKIKERFKESFCIMDVNTVLSVRYCTLKDNSLSLSINDKLDLIRYFMNDKEIKEIDGTIVIDEHAINEKIYKQKIEEALNNALENGKVKVNYQPIYNNKKGIFTSAEALMRIQDDDGNFISPDIFVPVAEKNGLIIKLGMNLFEQVCKLIKDYDLQNTSLDYIEVNLSVIQCMQHDLAQNLLEVMDKYDVAPSFINFEITETAASNSENTLLYNMRELLKHNSSFSLDDYGSGYSNINYILDLPIGLLKYDKNMVWSYFDSEKGRVILNCTVNMTKELNLMSLAEGVETKEQFEQIKRLGIEYTQGYYFSKPLPPEEFVKKIKG